MIARLLKLALICGVILALPLGALAATTVFEVTDGDHDAQITLQGAAYPPSGDTGTAIDLTATTISVQKTVGFTGSAAVLAFDTAGIPDDATITAASLVLNVTATTNTDNRQLLVDWYSGVPPITIADYDETGDGSAGGFGVAAISTGSQTFDLNITSHTISMTGITSLRLTISGAEPTGNNQVVFESFDNAGTDEPQLSVTYTTPLEQTTPNLGTIAPITAYEGVREAGDILLIVPYDITTGAAGLPSELAQNEYQVIFREGTAYFQVVNPVSTSENGLLGYREGFVSFYFSAQQVADQGIVFNSPGIYTVELDAINGVQNTTSTTINYRSAGVDDLETDLGTLAQVLEASWNLDVINSGRLTATGQDYFEATVPFLQQMVPGFVNILTARVDPGRAVHDTTASDSAANFWAGTSVETSFTSLGSLWGMTAMQFKTGATFFIAFLVGIGVLIFQRPAWMALMGGGMVVVAAPVIGMAPMALGLVIGLVGFFCGTWAWWVSRG